MSVKCGCCGKDSKSNTCKYCGFLNIVALGDAAARGQEKRAKEYKASVVKKLTDFSVSACKYNWNKGSSKLDEKAVELRIANGEQCFNKIVRSSTPLGQNADPDGKKLPLVVTYKFNGSKKQLKVEAATKKTSKPWQVGVMLRDDLTLSLYLGTEQDCTVTDNLELELK